MLEEFLNEFEVDSAESIFRHIEYDYSVLNNKNIAIYVDKIIEKDSIENRTNKIKMAKYIANVFIRINEEKNSNISLYIIDSNSSKEYDIYSKIESVHVINQSENKYIKDDSIDVMCIVDLLYNDYSSLKSAELEAGLEKFVKLVELYNVNHMIVLSDYRGYGNNKIGTSVSENEIRESDNSNKALIGDRIRYIENKLRKISESKNRYITILRMGIIIAPGISVNNPIINSMINSVINNESIKVSRSKERASYIYINDVLMAILYSCLEKYKGNTYNVAHNLGKLSTGELVEILYHNFSDTTSIDLSYEYEDYNLVELNVSRIMNKGWIPSVSVEDALILKIKSEKNKDEEFIFDDTYQGKLDTIHDILLGLLLDIDKICRENDIKYFLAGGTLLGAIRHGKFIPWDDDVDVMMLREDYDKFLSVVKDKLPKHLFLQTPITDPTSHSVFTRIRINDTLFATEFTSRFEEMHNGIFIDIVCHDKTANSKLMQKLHIFMTLFTRSMVFNKWKGTPMNYGGKHKIICKIATFLKNILPMRFLERIQDKVISFYKNSKKSKYLYDGMGRNLRRGVFPSYYLDEVELIDFAGKKLPVPKEYDKYLTYLYGDYMKMIPVSERRTSHSIALIDLGKYIDYEID